MELKQLLPYAPYGIQFKCTDTVSGEFEILPLVKIHLDHESVEIGAIEYDISYLGSDEVKMRLHPLDRISILGDERFPINEHTINQLLVEKHNVEYGMFSVYKNEISLEIEPDPEARYDMYKEIPFEVFYTVQEQLCKGHYDWQGLIEKGLAEPIEI
jgi:hypothetical protein